MTETSVWLITGLGLLLITSLAALFGGSSIRQWYRRGSSKRFSDALEASSLGMNQRTNG